MPTFNHPSGDSGPEKGADEGKTNFVHLSQHSNHLFDFHVVDEGVDDFAGEAEEDTFEDVDPPLSQSLKNNASHTSTKSTATHSQTEKPTDHAEDTVRTDDLPSEIVQTQPCKRNEKNISKSPIIITH